MRRLCVNTLCSFALFLAFSSYGLRLDDAIQIKNGTVMRDSAPFMLRAVEVPDFAADKSRDELDQILFRASDVGLTTICMDIPGWAPDGGAIAGEDLARLKARMDECATRRMGAIVRIFGENAPADRHQAVRTAAAAFKDELRAAYWIDGADAAALAAEFKAAAPEVVVIPLDIAVVNAAADAQADKPQLLFHAIPSREQADALHFVIDQGTDYAAVDAALANPVELAPWVPDNSMLSEQERAEGYISLFDGKTLNGWWFYGRNTNGFAVEDGAIVWKALGGEALYSRDRYANFVLRLDWKIGKGGNSGVYIRAPRANRQSMTGFEIQMQGDHGRPIDIHHTGSIYSVLAPAVDATKPEGEWNSYEIMADGPKVKVVLNGQVVQDLNLDENPKLKNRLRKGFIGLQDHGKYVAFRNIRIKTL